MHDSNCRINTRRHFLLKYLCGPPLRTDDGTTFRGRFLLLHPLHFPLLPNGRENACAPLIAATRAARKAGAERSYSFDLFARRWLRGGGGWVVKDPVPRETSHTSNANDEVPPAEPLCGIRDDWQVGRQEQQVLFPRCHVPYRRRKSLQHHHPSSSSSFPTILICLLGLCSGRLKAPPSATAGENRDVQRD